MWKGVIKYHYTKYLDQRILCTTNVMQHIQEDVWNVATASCPRVVLKAALDSGPIVFESIFASAHH